MKIKKNQKPIEYDAYFKYLCNRCGFDHWLSLKEASTSKFKVVCDCGNIFIVRRVSGIKVKYHTKKNIAKKINNTIITNGNNITVENQIIQKTIPIDLLNKTISVLLSYGFTNNESKDLAIKSYEINSVETPILLVKQILESLRSTNVS